MGLNEVFKKVADIESKATELASHKIDLGIAEDVKKAYTEAIAARKKSFDVMQKFKADTALALKQLNDLKAINERAVPIFAKYEAAAKQLGLPLPPEVMQQKQNIQDGLKGVLVTNPKILASIKF
jgi:hypothetical protein